MRSVLDLLEKLDIGESRHALVRVVAEGALAHCELESARRPNGLKALALRKDPPHLADYALQLIRPAGDASMGRAQARVMRHLGARGDVSRFFKGAVGALPALHADERGALALPAGVRVEFFADVPAALADGGMGGAQEQSATSRHSLGASSASIGLLWASPWT